MNSSQITMLIAIGIYLIFMLLIGIYYSKKNKDTSDFYLGGRTLGPFVTAMSAEASDMSGWLLMGLPGLAYLSGIADATWTAIGLAIGTYINWLLIAKRLRTYSHHLNAITLPDFFSKRYKDKSNLLNCIAAVIIIIFFIPYTASGFAACGKLFGTIFGMDYLVAMIVSAIVIVGYTTLGGFLAASTTDLIQSIVMTVALILVLGYGINTAGGIDAVIENAKGMSGYFDFFTTHNITTNSSNDYSLLQIVSTLAWGLGYFGMPHVLLRFMAIEDKDKLVVSRRIATVWVIISLGVAIFIGIVGNAMTKAGVVPTLVDSKSETIIINIASLIGEHGILAAFVAGIILAGIVAATMSTADSQLLAASSSVSQNLFVDFLGIKLDEKKSIFVARGTVLMISVIGVILAADPNNSVFEIVSFAWAGFGATFGPVVLAALFWKRSNHYGAIASMIASGLTIFVWKYLVRPMGGILDIYELLPAFIIGVLVLVVVSLLTKKPEKEICTSFDEYRQLLQK